MRMRERVHDRRPSYAPFTFKRVGAMDDALLACSVGDIAWLKRCLSSDFNPSTANKEVFTGRMRRKYKLATERSLAFTGAKLSAPSIQEWPLRLPETPAQQL